MVPIHDTDIAQERWSKSEWEHYELWEKIEGRLRRRKWLWIAATCVVFTALSSVPIVADRWPKWHTLSLSRKLAQEINALKRHAAVEHQAFRIRFQSGGRLSFVIEKAANCEDPSPVTVETGSLLQDSASPRFQMLSAPQGKELGIPGLTDTFCYDPLHGSEESTKGRDLIGFAIFPADDLAVKDLAVPPRLDRMTILLLKGPSAEISFD